MTRVEGQGVVIDRSVDDVWRFMTDISNMPQWEENQADWKQTSGGPIDSGTTFSDHIPTVHRPTLRLGDEDQPPNHGIRAQSEVRY